ncbi:MAG: NADH:ubiquinone oxidoreductase [Alphaproteobacteria bacterium]|nr:NADH:ubiquinone oxidoreductase [Alphaproteobacteria bacterium]
MSGESYIVETALLLLAALALGGAIGFWARRWFAPRAVDDGQPAARAEAQSAPMAASAEAEAVVVPEPPASAPAEQAAPDAVADGNGPELLSAARDGGGDDLKKIKGVGPKIEATLHALGVFHFDQIASWDAEAVAWVDERLSFRGRIERENWVAQAKALIAGSGSSGA